MLPAGRQRNRDAGRKGQFDVVRDGELVYSKHEMGRFPDEGEIAARWRLATSASQPAQLECSPGRARVEPSRDWSFLSSAQAGQVFVVLLALLPEPVRPVSFEHLRLKAWFPLTSTGPLLPTRTLPDTRLLSTAWLAPVSRLDRQTTLDRVADDRDVARAVRDGDVPLERVTGTTRPAEDEPRSSVGQGAATADGVADRCGAGVREVAADLDVVREERAARLDPLTLLFTTVPGRRPHVSPALTMTLWVVPKYVPLHVVVPELTVCARTDAASVCCGAAL